MTAQDGWLTVDDVSVRWSGRSVLSLSYQSAHFPLHDVELCSVSSAVVMSRTGEWLSSWAVMPPTI